MNRAFQLTRKRLLCVEELERIHAAAVKLLTTHGIRILHERARELAAQRGLRVVGERAYPEAAHIEELTRDRGFIPWNEEESEEPSVEIMLGGSTYTTHYHDLETDEVRPHTFESARDGAKLMDAMTDFGVVGSAPGAPADIPGELQALAKYRIGAQYSRHGRAPVQAESARSLPFLVAMSKVLGHPCQSIELYVVSPLTLPSEFLDTVLAPTPLVPDAHISNMSSVGGTAPIRIGDALALGAAEVIGCAIIVQAITGRPVGWSVRVCPMDLRFLILSLGGPEEMLFQLASNELNAYYHNYAPGQASGMLHTQAKLPGIQATAEKMSQLTLGAAMGARSFYGAATLSLDEVFSAEQLMHECELRDHLSRMVRGMDADCSPDALLSEEVAVGMQAGFYGLDSTLDVRREVYWTPQLYERRALAGWLGAGSPDLRRKAKELVRERLAEYNYELAPDLCQELDRIYHQAAKELA